MINALEQIKAGWLWLYSHKTKLLGILGSVLTYAYMNQDKLGLFIAPKYYARCVAVIAASTFVVGCVNTLKEWRAK